MAYYRKRIALVEARRYTRNGNGMEAEDVAKWCGGLQTNEGLFIDQGALTLFCDYGDWVVQLAPGEFDVLKPDAFEATFVEA